MTAKQKQALLAYLGYYDGPLDGLWGEKSQRATIDFQRAYMEQTEVDGVFGAATEKRIREVVASGEEPKESVQIDTAAPDWWRDIRYFTRSEFRCPCGKCGGFPKEPEEKLMRILDDIREHFGVPITIVPLPPNNPHAGGSGVRCQAYNDSLSGSVPNSRHVQGKAADIIVRGFSGSAVEAYCQSLVKQGRLRYCYVIGGGNSVHIDIL